MVMEKEGITKFVKDRDGAHRLKVYRTRASGVITV
jgi:hypothetical protein